MIEDSVLTSTKNILGLSLDYTAFDLDITTHINAAFGTLSQLGYGPFFITTKEDLWSTFNLDDHILAQIKTYVFLKVRLLFDPPSTSFHLEAMKNQVLELEWRLNVASEGAFNE